MLSTVEVNEPICLPMRILSDMPIILYALANVVWTGLSGERDSPSLPYFQFDYSLDSKRAWDSGALNQHNTGSVSFDRVIAAI